MSQKSLTDAPTTPTPPTPAYEGHLRSGRARSLPVTAGDQGDPKEGTTTPPGVRDDDGFWLASSASGPRTTPMDRAVVVEGTPLRQQNRFSEGFSDNEEGSPLLLSEPGPPTAFAPPGSRVAALTPAAVEAALAAISDNDRQRARDYDTNMATFGGRVSRFEEIFSEVNESIGLVRAESASLVVLNKHTSHVVDTSIETFLWIMENKAKENAAALEAFNQRSLAATEAHMTTIAEAHKKTIGDMQAKLQGSFDRMRYLEKTFQDVLGLITTHLETQLPAILTDVVGTALAPTLTTVLNECSQRPIVPLGMVQ